MEIYTIGFTKKKASEFFGLLKKHAIKRLIDIRLNNSSTLAGFTKKDDLKYFLKQICDAEYIHEPMLAPSKEILDSYRDNKIGWSEFVNNFKTLMHDRHIEKYIKKETFDIPTVLLCSESTSEHCHRRLVAEYLKEKWGDVEIIHI